MDWRTLFTLEHDQVHAAAVAHLDNNHHVPDLLLRGMSEEQVRLTPSEGQNSVAWLLWHMTRCEDVVGGNILSDAGQLNDDGWDVKMGIARRDIGTGMTSVEVRDLSQRIDIAALLEYRNAVGRRTHQLITDIDDQILEQPVTRDDVNALRAIETFGAHAAWVGDFWQTKPRFWFLWLATGHCHQHLGEAITVRSLLGIPLAS